MIQVLFAWIHITKSTYKSFSQKGEIDFIKLTEEFNLMIEETPKITQEFMERIKENAEQGTISYTFGKVIIDVFPYVFPPEEQFSKSFQVVQQNEEFEDKVVLDIGTGTGIQAIYAALSGAKNVDAVDIFPTAVLCAKHNVKLNGLEDQIQIYESDLFSNLPKRKYDLILGNLPCLNLPQEDIRFHCLFDPGFEYHKRLLKEAKEFLVEDGRLVVPIIDLLGNQEFSSFEKLSEKNGYYCINRQSLFLESHEWRKYELKVK